ncbi:MAG: glycosyltransferase [Holosporaceae bacterium]|nr:MAG: glycosyltransferase [Holosporaceae bacterium]
MLCQSLLHKKFTKNMALHKKIVTIHRGVDLGTFDANKVTESMVQNMISEMQIPEDKHIFLLPGRLTRIKGHEVLFDAVSRMRRDDFICLIVGSFKNKNYLRELDEQARHYGFRDRLYIFNNCKDMATLYALATASISPSTRPETFGRTAAEAGAMGCIVIGSNHGGTKEIIVDEKQVFFLNQKTAYNWQKS